MILRSALAACLALVFGTAAATDACPRGECFRGSSISIVVGFGAGGGYDAYARMIAPELERLTGATVTVRNRPGAGGLLALNELAATRGDGLTLGMINVTAATLAQGLGVEAARFDLGRFTWLGGVESALRALVVPADASAFPWRKADARPAPLRWAAGGSTDDMAMNAALLSESLGVKARIVTGYKGSNEAVLGMVRGEADALIISADSARRYAASRAIKVAAILSPTRSPLFPDVPTIFEAVDSADRSGEWLRLLIDLSALGRGLAATPGTPEDRTAFLRSALRQILSDAEFRRRAAQAGRSIEFRSPEELAGAVTSVLRAMQDRPGLRHVLLEKFY